jgi:hypothetical protein
LFSALDEALKKANSEEICIAFGVGICGHVAQTKETVVLKDAYEVRKKHLLISFEYTAQNLYISPFTRILMQIPSR